VLQVQLIKQKQTQVGLGKRWTTTEAARKVANVNLVNANQNIQEMVDTYDEKLRQMKEE
jgi:hypothetical protein